MNEVQIQRWYEQYKTGLFRYILSMTRDPQLAEDILQDTFVQLIVGGIRFEPGKERAWLYKVARNKCLDALKRRKRTQALSVPAVAEPQTWTFLELLAPLTAAEQELVTLKIIGGFSHKEIAKLTGMTAAAAQKRYERAIRKLRKEMEESE